MTCPLDAVPGDPVDSYAWTVDNVVTEVTAQDAADMNAAVEMPDQPDYDWTGVLGETSSEEAAA